MIKFLQPGCAKRVLQEGAKRKPSDCLAISQEEEEEEEELSTFQDSILRLRHARQKGEAVLQELGCLDTSEWELRREALLFLLRADAVLLPEWSILLLLKEERPSNLLRVDLLRVALVAWEVGRRICIFKMLKREASLRRRLLRLLASASREEADVFGAEVCA